MWVGLTFFCMGVGGCGRVSPFFGWMWVDEGECDLYMAGCGWMWVCLTFS